MLGICNIIISLGKYVSRIWLATDTFILLLKSCLPIQYVQFFYLSFPAHSPTLARTSSSNNASSLWRVLFLLQPYYNQMCMFICDPSGFLNILIFKHHKGWRFNPLGCFARLFCLIYIACEGNIIYPPT